MALLRSAELMIEKGFTYFVIMDGNTQTNYQAISSPSYARTTGTVDRYTNTFNAKTTFVGGSTTMIQSPTTTNIVVGFSKPPANENRMVFDAYQVFASLAPKYKK